MLTLGIILPILAQQKEINTKEVKQQITNAIDFKKGLVFIFDKFKLIDKMLMSTHK